MNTEPKFVCLPLKAGVKPLAHRDNDESMYLPGLLEHPMIDGLMLSLNERLFGDLLEYKNTKTGQVFTEGPTEKRFRIMWKKPYKMNYVVPDGMIDGLVSGKEPTGYYLGLLDNPPTIRALYN